MVDANLMKRRDFAARHGRSRMAVSRWEQRGLLMIVGGLVDVAESEARMRAAGVETAALGEALAPDAPELSKFLADLAGGRFATQVEADRVKANALAGLRVLEYRRKAGELVEMEAAETVLFEEARGIRDALLRWPGEAAPTIAADLGVADVALVSRTLGEHVRKLLDGLGEPAAAGLRDGSS